MKSVEKIEDVKPEIVKEFKGVTQEQLDKSLETQFYFIKEELQDFKAEIRKELGFNEGRLFNGFTKRANNESTQILIRIDELIHKLGDTK